MHLLGSRPEGEIFDHGADYWSAHTAAWNLFAENHQRHAFLEEVEKQAHAFVRKPLRWHQIQTLADALLKQNEMTVMEVASLLNHAAETFKLYRLTIRFQAALHGCALGSSTGSPSAIAAAFNAASADTRISAGIFATTSSAAASCTASYPSGYVVLPRQRSGMSDQRRRNLHLHVLPSEILLKVSDGGNGVRWSKVAAPGVRRVTAETQSPPR